MVDKCSGGSLNSERGEGAVAYRPARGELGFAAIRPGVVGDETSRDHFVLFFCPKGR